VRRTILKTSPSRPLLIVVAAVVPLLAILAVLATDADSARRQKVEAGSPGALIANADGVWTFAMEQHAVLGQTQDYTHGMLTVESPVSSDVVLERVYVTTTVGDIELVDAFVAPPPRPLLYTSSADMFPPASASAVDYLPAADHVLKPPDENTTGSHRNTNVVLHLRSAGRSLPAGYRQICLDYQIRSADTGETKLFSQCYDHSFAICGGTLEACEEEVCGTLDDC
jgi:hypothetical protein